VGEYIVAEWLAIWSLTCTGGSMSQSAYGSSVSSAWRLRRPRESWRSDGGMAYVTSSPEQHTPALGYSTHHNSFLSHQKKLNIVRVGVLVPKIDTYLDSTPPHRPRLLEVSNQARCRLNLRHSYSMGCVFLGGCSTNILKSAFPPTL
jgi:hypothetical protein